MKKLQLRALSLACVVCLLISLGVVCISAATRTVLADANELAATPPMGWNTWNKYGADISEKLVMNAADAMVSSGMKDAGYTYIVIDDAWQASTRDANGNLQPDAARFPHGIKYVADYVHSKGLKLGIYSDNGVKTCQFRPGSEGYEAQDAKTFASWGVDYLKYDYCNNLTASGTTLWAPDIDKITVENSDKSFSETIEAESHDNTLSGGAQVSSSSSCSGGAKVGYIGSGGTLKFNKINVPTDGTYMITVYYACDFYRSFNVSVNGGTSQTCLPDNTGSFANIEGYPIKETLQKGVNTLLIDNPTTSKQIKNDTKTQYKTMGDALKATGRPICYSICEWGTNSPWGWGKGIGNLWRTTSDISDNWNSMLSNFEWNAKLAKYAGPGGWNDPDMLEVGNGGMTDTEYRSHFSLWCMEAAPLMAGNDLTNMSASTSQILTNPDAIRIDQDTLGAQATKVGSYNGCEVYRKPLANGDLAMLALNTGSAAANVTVPLKDLAYENPKGITAFDIWSKQTATFSDQVNAAVQPHGVMMFRLRFTDSADSSPLQAVSSKVSSSASAVLSSQPLSSSGVTSGVSADSSSKSVLSSDNSISGNISSRSNGSAVSKAGAANVPTGSNAAPVASIFILALGSVAVGVVLRRRITRKNRRG